MSSDMIDFLTGWITPVLAASGFELFACQVMEHGSVKHVEFLIDRPQGGITLDECVAVNRTIMIMRQNEVRLDEFSFSVSSPGMDRPLRTEKDFFRVMGRPIRVHMKEGVAGPRQYEGVLKGVCGAQIQLEMADGQVDLCRDDIQKAVQQV